MTMTDTSTTTTTATDPLVLTPDKDLPKVLDPVLDHLQATVVKAFPAQQDLANQLRVADAKIEAEDELARRGTGPVQDALADYQATMEPLAQAHRSLRLARQAQDLGTGTVTAKDLAEREADYVTALRAAQAGERALVAEVRNHLRLVEESGQHDLAYRYLQPLLDTRLDFLTGQRPLPLPDGDDGPERPASGEDRMTHITEYRKRAATTLAQLEADFALAIQDDRAARYELAQELKRMASPTHPMAGARKALNQSINDLRRLVAKGADRHQRVSDATKERQRAEDDLAAVAKGDPTDDLEAELAKRQKALDAAVAAEADYQRQVIKAIDEVRLKIPNNDARRRVVDDLKTSVQVAILEQNHDRVRAELQQAAKGIARSGSSITTTLSATLGASMGVVGEVEASAALTANLGLTWKIANANNKFTATFAHAEKANLKTAAGGEVGSAKLGGVLQGTGGGVFTTTRTYDSLEDLVAKETALVYLTSPVTYGKPTRWDWSGKKDIDLVKERDKLLRIDHANRADLEARLRNLGALTSGQGLKPASAPGVDVTTTRSRAAAVESGGGLVAEIADHAKLGASFKIGAAKAREQDHKIVSFLDDVEDNPALQAIHATKRPDYFGWYEPGRTGDRITSGAATKRLAELEEDLENTRQVRRQALADIDALKAMPASATRRKQLEQARDRLQAAESSLAAGADQLRENLDYLQIEYSGFVNLANHIERGIIPETDATRQMRKAYLRDRGISSGGNAEYVKATALNYAYLRRLYERSFPDAAPPPQEVKRLNDFGADIRVPPLTINDNEFRKAFELKADSPIRRVATYSGSVALSAGAGGTITDGDGDKLQGASHSGQLQVGFSLAQSRVHGDLEPTETLTLSVELGGGAIGDNFVGNLLGTDTVKSLLSSAPLRKKKAKDPTKQNRDALQSELKRVLADLVLGGGNTVDMKLVRKNDSWWLQSAVASETSQRSLGIKGTIPVGAGVGVVAAASVARSKKEVKREYFGSNTLSTLTDLYRDRHRVDDDSDDDSRWNDFCDRSKLLDRIAAQIDTTSATNPSGPGSFTELVDQIKAKEAQGGTRGKARLIKLKGPDGAAAGVLNDVGDWLVALATSDDATDRRAADTFIAAYEQPSKTKAQRTARARAMADALRSMTARKAAQEDQADGFRRKRRIGAQDVDRYVAKRVTEESRRLRSDLARAVGGKVGARSLRDLRAAATEHFQATGDDRSFDLLRRAHGLEHVATTFTDLRRVGNKADRETAMASLGTDLSTMFAEPKLYLSREVEGELVRQGKVVVVQPVVKKGRSAEVTAKSIDKAVERGIGRIRRTGVSTARAGSVQMVSDYGSERTTWTPEKADAKARAARAKEIKHKKAKRGLGRLVKGPKSIGRRVKKGLRS